MKARLKIFQAGFLYAQAGNPIGRSSQISRGLWWEHISPRLIISGPAIGRAESACLEQRGNFLAD